MLPIKDYLDVLNENKSQAVSGDVKKPGKDYLDGLKVAKHSLPDGIDKPEEGPYNSDDNDSKPKALKKSNLNDSANPFDSLYRILTELHLL